MYEITYDYRIWEQDFEEIDKATQKIILKTIEKKLFSNPEKFGQKLKKPLSGFYKLRVGNYRIIYTIEKNTAFILKIGHRRSVYKKVLKRIQ